MTIQAIILITISAFSHAGWNFTVKKYHPSPSFFLLANTLGVIFFSPLLLLVASPFTAFTQHITILLISTGFFMALYLYTLARAYKHGHLSLVYPTVRALPILMVTLFLFTFNSESFSILYLLGIFFIITGLYLHWSNSGSTTFTPGLNPSTGIFVILAAAGITGYSLIDAEGINLLVKIDSFSEITAPLSYIIFQGFFASLWLTGFVLLDPLERKQAKEILVKEKASTLVLGLIIYATYVLVLASMLYAENVGYVLAFRQLSIPVGSLLGWFFLRENFNLKKFTGVIILLTGLFMVALG